MTRIFEPAVSRAELEGLTLHGLRYTAIGLLIEAAAHIETIDQRLGHSSNSRDRRCLRLAAADR